jgi:hypothetical protein
MKVNYVFFYLSFNGLELNTKHSFHGRIFFKPQNFQFPNEIMPVNFYLHGQRADVAVKKIKMFCSYKIVALVLLENKYGKNINDKEDT